MDTSQRGNQAEAAVLSALVHQNFEVLIPFGEGQPYDLVIHVSDNVFLRIQCKTAWPNGGCLSFNAHATDHGRGPQSYIGLAELFGVYFPPRRSVYLVPVGVVGRNEGRLRLEPTLNNQRRRVRLATEYEVERWTVAALREIAGERMTPSELKALAG